MTNLRIPPKRLLITNMKAVSYISNILKVWLKIKLHKILARHQNQKSRVSNSNEMPVELQCQGRTKVDVICCKILVNHS